MVTNLCPFYINETEIVGHKVEWDVSQAEGSGKSFLGREEIWSNERKEVG